MSFDISSPSDRLDLEPDDPPIDWNGKIFVNRPKPVSGEFWIVTESGDVHEVAYDDMASMFLRHDQYSRQDGEPGSWSDDEIIGWTTNQEDAEEAAELFLEFVE